jgi:hypothetical protein
MIRSFDTVRIPRDEIVSLDRAADGRFLHCPKSALDSFFLAARIFVWKQWYCQCLRIEFTS